MAGDKHIIRAAVWGMTFFTFRKKQFAELCLQQSEQAVKEF